MQANVEPRLAAPFDARQVVPTKADLTDATNFPYAYIGMIVSVQAEGKAYILTQSDTTVLANWKELGSGGGGSDAELTSDLTVSNPIGEWEMDEVIAQGTTLETVIRGMLSQTYYPTYTAPSASINYSASTLVKTGTTIPATAATVLFNAGAITLEGTKQADRAGAATGYTLATSGATTDYSNTNTTGNFDVTALTRASKGNIVMTATVDYGEGPQPLDSNGDPYETPLPAGSVTATRTIEFINPFYWGVSSTPTVTSVAGLTEDVSKKGQKQYTYTTNNQYMVIAYEASYGNLTSILDPNNFETINGWNKSTLTVDGVNYNLYVANTATTATAKYTFKF